MKKTLLSIALLGASTAYVVSANHLFDHLEGPEREVGEAVVAPAAAASLSSSSSAAVTLSAASPSSSAEPVASPADLLPPSLRHAPLPRTTVASATSSQGSEVPAPAATPAPRTDVAVAEPAVPPLPRPRPADAPSIETAQAADVATNASPYSDGSFRGTSENAYYGRVQVQVTISGGQITRVTALDYPQDRRTSRYINSQALPMLEQEVIQAQNANVDGVTGATLTSEAYVRSLRRALAQAGGNNA